MSENKTGVKRRFNIIDVLVIIAVAAIVAAVVLRFNIADRIGAKSDRDTVIVSFLICDVRPTSADAMIPGDMFYIDSNGAKLGELIGITTSDAEQFLENSDGEITLQYNPAQCDIRGEFRAKGAMTESGFMLGGTQYIGANKEILVRSRHISVTIRITGIREAA